MESTARKSGLPVWAKFLLGLTLFFLFSIVVLVGAASIFFADFQKKNTDPTVVKKIANSIVTIDDPLPAGFSWVVGLDIFGLKMAAVNHKPDNLELILTSLPSSKASNSLEDNISSSEQNPALANATGTQSKFEAKVKGSEAVANKQFIYAIGVVKDRSGRDIPSLMGFFSPNDKGTSVMLVGVEESGAKVLTAVAADSKSDDKGKSSDKGSLPTNQLTGKITKVGAGSQNLINGYNLEATKQFLHAIKKF
jgi:hypothetical protein